MHAQGFITKDDLEAALEKQTATLTRNFLQELHKSGFVLTKVSN